MSLELTESINTLLPFPGTKNVRVLITGLALCRFNAALSTVRFLRHVAHHDLIMTVTKIQESNMEVLESNSYTLTKRQNVDISSSIVSAPPNNVVYDQNLRYLIGMKTLHGNGSSISDQNNLPNDRPSFLRLQNCAFYTHQLTANQFVFIDNNNNEHGNHGRFCEILGGYMEYARNGNIIISVNNLAGSPLVYPMNGFLYEIVFTNNCDGTPSCKTNADFRFVYDIIEDKNHPGVRYNLVPYPRQEIKPDLVTPGTAACLPVCEDC